MKSSNGVITVWPGRIWSSVDKLAVIFGIHYKVVLYFACMRGGRLYVMQFRQSLCTQCAADMTLEHLPRLRIETWFLHFLLNTGCKKSFCLEWDFCNTLYIYSGCKSPLSARAFQPTAGLTFIFLCRQRRTIIHSV